MSDGDSDLRVRPGRIGSTRAPKPKSFINQVLRSAKRSGHVGTGGGPGRKASGYGRSSFGRGRIAFSRARLFSSSRRVVVKARIARHQGRAFRSAPLNAHLSYLKRDGVTRDGEKAVMFDADSDRADDAGFAARSKNDRHHFRFIVSPEDAGEMTDLRAFTRDLARQMETDLGTRLDWVAVDHWNTDNPHVHLLVRGVDTQGADLVISRDYISRGLRSRAEDLVSIELGPKPEHEIKTTLEREITAERGSLDLSFSAGADCFNIADLVSCGLGPVTVCSDLLKPGGYGRLSQYILNLREAFRSTGAESLDDFIVKKAGTGRDVASSAMLNLAEYAGKVLENPAYSRDEEGEPSIKTGRTLEWFDCVHAPCRDACPTRQDIPEYMRRMAAGDSEGALKAIRITNPFPCVTGMICDQPCREKCTRINYDEPLQIREIKRFAAEGGRLPEVPVSPRPGGRGKASVIGAGPAGLSCAWFLRSVGFEVDVYERNGMPGGMVAAAIPAFRLPDDAIAKDIDAILAAGIRLHTGRTVDRSFLETLLATSDAVFMASGAQKTIPLRIPGADAAGVTDPLSFLFSSRNDRPDLAGRRVVVVGGGNTAMDAARTAYRLVGEEGSVTVAYRRAAREMPADRGEIRAARAEGIIIMELVTPVRVVETNGHVQGLQCTRNRQGGKGPDGRREAIPIPGTEFIIPCDLIIPAIGQQPDAELADPDLMKTQPGSYRTRIPNLFIGGDALRGASTAINAVADGRLAAQEIIGTVTTAEGLQPPVVHCEEILAGRAVRLPGWHPDEPPDESRRSFIPSEPAMTLREAVEEASRCLGCDEICNVCVSVCPNLANFSYEVEPVRLDLEKALKNADGTIDILQDAVFTVRQRYQILNLNDLCNECGNCATFCPTSGRPFTDKPRLFLGAASFNQAVGGFLFTRHGGREVLIFREKDNIRTLTLTEGVFVYETNQVRARIEPSTFRLLKVDFLTPCVKEARFTFAAEMSIIMQGARQALPHLT